VCSRVLYRYQCYKRDNLSLLDMYDAGAGAGRRRRRRRRRCHAFDHGEGKGKTKGFIKTRVKDSIKPSALVFRVGGWVGVRRGEGKGWVGGWADGKTRGVYRAMKLMK
jgi:hypothetical protein